MADKKTVADVTAAAAKLTLSQRPEDAVGDRTPAVMHGVESKASAQTQLLDEEAEAELEAVTLAAAGSAARSARALPEGTVLADLASFRDKGKEIAIAMGLGKAEEAAAADAKHKFWATQPVSKFSEQPDPSLNGPIEADKPVSEIRAEPYGLPGGFEWCTLDITQPAVLTELYDLLANNYVEDDDAMFRFNYSREFLLWALTPPGYFVDWLVGVRVSKTRKLVASITGVPAELRVYGVGPKKMCEINYLCVDKKLRSKRLAPVLIREVTRRVHLKGIFQAAYTAGVVLPRPVTSARYWHRSIDPKKLIEVGFSGLAPRMTLARTIRLYALPKETKSVGLRPMQPADVPTACALLNSYLSKFALHPVFSESDFAHWLLPRPGVIDTFVLAGADGKVTDMLSFYHLPSFVMNNPKHEILNAAYLYYYAASTISISQLLEDSLVLAASKGVDVVNCLDIIENQPHLKDLKFQPGDGSLQYYLYNWACPQMDPAQLALVLL